MHRALTEKAQMVVTFAKHEAQRMGHRYLGTEHLLLGLVREGTGVAAVVLERLGVEPLRVRAEVERCTEDGTGPAGGGGELPWDPSAKRAFECAFEEAKRLGQNYVGTEHLLLGLLQEGEGVAAQVLTIMGVGFDDVNEQITYLLGAGPTAEEEAEENAPCRRAARGTFELQVEGTFAAAHNLRGYQGECEKLHGHNWRVEVRVASDELDELGMVLDFRDLKAALGEVLDRLDHEYLNEVPPFDTLNPTTENLCRHVAEELGARLPGGCSVRRVTCWESPRCSASYIPRPGL